MSADLSHFAINADDVPAARTFYEAVFGWTFEAWGPPAFFKINTNSSIRDGEKPIEGALQQRRELNGKVATGPECTFGVADVDATAAAVVQAGGKIVMDRFTISGVGHLIFFEDVAGNTIGAMQYDPDA